MMAQTRPRSWWYPWIIVAFFAVVVSVNGFMIYTATTTFTGLETEGHYVKGLKYNDNLDGVKKQAELGWKDITSWTPLSQNGTERSGRLKVVFLDKAGNPLEGMKADALLIRPTHEGYDQEASLQSIGNGVYEFAMTLPLPGQWDVRILASKGDDLYQRVQRLHIK